MKLRSQRALVQYPALRCPGSLSVERPIPDSYRESERAPPISARVIPKWEVCVSSTRCMSAVKFFLPLVSRNQYGFGVSPMTKSTPPVGLPAPMPPEGPAAPEMKQKKAKRKGGLGTLALVLGILGIIFAFIPHASGFGICLGVVAVVLGGIGLLRKRSRALTGAILGVIALVLGIIFLNVYSSSSSTSPAPAAGPSISAASPKASPTSVVAAPPAKPAAPAARPAKPAGTVTQLQALTAAEGYLTSGQGFSQDGLIAQLTSSAGDGFARADPTCQAGTVPTGHSKSA